jgi:tetratricopeptide (TPR) repeat protein
MPAEHARLDELRRRVQQDPASIAFAQLAEEYRRGGDLEEAVRVCRAGLAHRPSYFSARVTLGRALMALGQHREAEAEFELVLQTAPDNLLALKSLEELRERGPAVGEAPGRTEAPVPGPQPIAAREEVHEAPTPTPAVNPAQQELEGWLGAVRADRAARKGASAQ